MAASFKVYIPARFAASRLPGKPLADIAGKPLVQHVYENAAASGAEGNKPAAQARRDPLTLVGGPDTIVKQLKAFHDQCGVGVVDLGFQHTGTSHREVMTAIELFGREVLPRIKAF